MREATFGDRLRYEFDNIMSKGTVALIACLALLSFAILFFFSLFVWVTGVAPSADDGSQPGLVKLLWMALMRTLDAGTMGGDEGGWVFLFSMLGVTFGGIFVISTFIGVLTSGIEERLEELRKGRSRVIEHDHTVILGWSSQAFAIINELVIANASRKHPCIVVMGEHDKVEMEDEIKERVPDPQNTRIVCRTGSPIDLADLDMVGVQTSRSIIILAPDDDDPDSSVIKTMLAITNSPNRRKAPYHIVAEMNDPKNMDAARIVGRHEAELVLVGDLISRITVQTCRQSGLSVVYTELLDFDGAEIYFHEDSGLLGKTFGESLFAYEDSVVFGLCKHDGRILVNPPMDHLLEGGDKVMAVAEDDDALKLSGKTEFGIDTSAIRMVTPPPPKPERTLILGWNWRITRIVSELDQYVAPGSELLIVADHANGKDEISATCGRTSKNQKLFYRNGDTTSRALLEELKVERFDHLILLCSEDLPQQQSDARTLITLLHLRDMADKGHFELSIVSEMLDIRNRELAEVTKADDFIVSDKLVSLMLSQISENKKLNAVFADLFSPEGSEIYLKPAEHYITPGAPVSFYTVLESARARGHAAIGYRVEADGKDGKKAYGVHVNPHKSEMITFAADDKVIVLAEN